MTTKIEWTDETWNPITGCTVKSAGCRDCYAMTLAGTRLKNHPSRAGLTRQNADGKHIWTGEVRFNEAWLDQPLKWQQPRMIFVCAHGDLFHESVPDEWIDRVFAVMALAPDHIFQILTKRPDRMREYFQRMDEPHKYFDFVRDDDWDGPWVALAQILEDSGVDHRGIQCDWPLPNVWLGTSVEDQASADERIPDLLATPAAMRWLSMEPLLGPVDLTKIGYNRDVEQAKQVYALPTDNIDAFVSYWNAFDGIFSAWEENSAGELINHHGAAHINFDSGLDWVVLGGESGSTARPMHPDWARHIRDQCEAAGVPFFFKQWGEWLPCNVMPSKARGWRIVEGEGLANVGKKKAGRELDGRTHDTFPQVAS